MVRLKNATLSYTDDEQVAYTMHLIVRSALLCK
jgi:hypothetical protein